MCPQDFQNFLINFLKYSKKKKKIKNTGILLSLCNSRKSVWLGSILSVEEHSPTQSGSILGSLGSVCTMQSSLRGWNSVAKCTALAINIRLFGRWYGRTVVRKIYGFLVPLYGCPVKNTVFCFSALKTDFLKLFWLEGWFFFCYSQFWAEGAILVVKCWSYTGRW